MSTTSPEGDENQQTPLLFGSGALVGDEKAYNFSEGTEAVNQTVADLGHLVVSADTILDTGNPYIDLTAPDHLHTEQPGATRPGVEPLVAATGTGQPEDFSQLAAEAAATAAIQHGF